MRASPYVLRSVVSETKLPPRNPKYPGNARRRLTLSCGHTVERAHVRGILVRCDTCEDQKRINRGVKA